MVTAASPSLLHSEPARADMLFLHGREAGRSMEGRGAADDESEGGAASDGRQSGRWLSEVVCGAL